MTASAGTADAPVFERILEFRRTKDEPWEPAMCCLTLADGQNLALRLLDADGETTRFATPLTDPLTLQVDASKLESDRRLDVFDEENEHGVQLRFSSYAEGTALVLAMLSALLRSTGCVRAQALILNEDSVRRAAGVDNPATQSYSVHIAVQSALLYDSWSMAAQGDLVVDQHLEGSDACRCQASVGEGTPAIAADNPVAAAVLRARDGMRIAVAVDAAMLRGTSASAFGLTWLPDALREALGESNCIAALLLTVERVEVGDDAKRESIKRRLQRQGAHAGALRDSGTPVVLRKVTTAGAAGATPNRSFDYPIAEAAVAANSSFGPRSLPPTGDSTAAPSSSQRASRVSESRQATTGKQKSSAYEAEPSPSTTGSGDASAITDAAYDAVATKKKKSSKSRVLEPDDDSVRAGDGAQRGSAATQEVTATEFVSSTGVSAEKRGRRGGDAPSKRSDAAVEEVSVAAACRTGSPASPRAAAVGAALDAQQLMDFQFKLDRKKQRILKLEAEVFQQLEAAEHQRQLNEVKEAEISMQQATLAAERAQIAQQQDAFRLQQLTFYQQQPQPSHLVDDGDDGGNGTSTKLRGTIGGSATRRGGVGAKASVSPAGKGEREPLLLGGGGGGLTHIQGPESTFTLRLEHPFYDNSDLPPAIQRCYPATTGLLHVLHHPCGVATLLGLLGGGIGLIGWFTATNAGSSTEPLWPAMILDLFAMLLVALVVYHKTALYDGLHRLDQSCAQFDSTLFLYQRSTMFAVFPVCLAVVCFMSLLVLLATDVGTIGRVGLVLSAAGCTLSFGGFSLFLMLVATVAWDRVSNVVSADAGTLCTRLAARRSVAQYQYVKNLVASISGDWSREILTALACMCAVMLYSVYAAIKVHSFSALLAYNSLFLWAALFSFLILKAVCGWQGATLGAVGHATLHCDRWARGDYNSEADMRLDDYVAFQQSLVLATLGGAYAKWVLTWFDDHGTVGRVWMWACGAMAIASLVMIPISVIYQFDSWDG